MTGGKNSPVGKGVLYKVRHAVRLNISAKILVYFLYIALVPLISVSYVLVNNARDQLLNDATVKQQVVANDLSRRVDNYLANDINMLAFEARLSSTHTLDNDRLDQSLSALFNQNASLQQVSIQTADGRQRTFTSQSSGLIKVTDSKVDLVSSGALQFMVGKSYLISVGRDDNNNPQIAVGLPILKTYGEPSNSLFASPVGTTDNVAGAIIGYFNVSDLWQSVISTTVGKGGYAYVVDGSGNLVTHPDKKFLDTHKDLAETEAVHQFINGNGRTTQTVSETGKDVISTPGGTTTGWAVIVEEPVESIYSGIDSFIKLSATTGVIATILTVLVGLFFSRQLIRPLRELSLGAKRLGRGDFDQKIEIHTKDELQELAETFNAMGQGIKKLIGDLKTNNLKLKIEQIKLNNIISSVNDGIVAVNSDGEIISINPPAAAFVNKSPKSLEGTLMDEQFNWEHDGNRFTPDLKNGGIYRYSDLVLNNGESVVYLDVMVAVLDHQESDVAAIITIHDQTASRELSFMKLDFVAIAAHELRTPLTVIRGYLDLLNTTAVNELTIYNLENLHKAMDGADQLRQLINKLLNIARIERGDMEIFIEKLNLTKLVKENVEQHKSVAAQKEQSLTYNCDTQRSVYVPADTASIVEVVNNLIGNALKYSGKGGKVDVNLTIHDKEVRVEVSDNGPGVPEELRDRLFTKFYRAERSLITGTRGTGLGLFISKTIIELQHGTIGIEPDEGKGSIFYFTLPIYDPVRDDDMIAKKTSGGIRGWFKKRPSSRG
ncbi:MAG: HAMP domain-containing protein [Candidatus Nomurabacteria bacterium]|nr:MAG: HAMP domain-containing protein [Candidatus Nomurabacteria bacterium]